MARVNPKGYLDERKAKGFGGDNDGPPRMGHEGKSVVTCLALAHTRGAAKGTWGVSALLLAVDGEDAGKVHIHDMWNDNQVHAFIAEGFGFRDSYENGLPVSGSDPDKFNADPDLLGEMERIVKCQDQSQSKDGAVVWNPTVAPSARRAPYTIGTFQKKPGLKDETKLYLEARWFNPLKKVGEKGPYFIENYRDQMAQVSDIRGWVNWFYGQCERKVKAANEAAAARRSSGGGGRDDDGGGDGGGWSDEVPF